MTHRLLVIDDEKDCAELTRCILEFSGFTVESVTNPVEGLERVKRDKYDAVVLDLMMPQMNGETWIKHLRELPEHAKTPVFVLSSKNLTADERKFLLTNDTHFIQKPFEPRRFSQIMRERLSGQ